MVTPTDANILPPPPCVIQENNEDHQTDSQQQEIIDMVEAAQGLPYMDEGGISSHFRLNILETSFMDTCNFMNLIIVCHAPPPPRNDQFHHPGCKKLEQEYIRIRYTSPVSLAEKYYVQI